MPEIDELRRKYPLMKHGPDPDCKFCAGTGEREVSRTAFLDGRTCCICLFVGGDPGEREEIARELGKAAKRIAGADHA